MKKKKVKKTKSNCMPPDEFDAYLYPPYPELDFFNQPSEISKIIQKARKKNGK